MLFLLIPFQILCIPVVSAHGYCNLILSWSAAAYTKLFRCSSILCEVICLHTAADIRIFCHTDNHFQFLTFIVIICIKSRKSYLILLLIVYFLSCNIALHDGNQTNLFSPAIYITGSFMNNILSGFCSRFIFCTLPGFCDCFNFCILFRPNLFLFCAFLYLPVRNQLCFSNPRLCRIYFHRYAACQQCCCCQHTHYLLYDSFSFSFHSL